jgi:hypothetical protein
MRVQRTPSVGDDRKTFHMLTPDEILDFAERHRRYTGHVGELVRAELGVTPARFYVLLQRALHDPHLLARRPDEVRRQQRLHEARLAVRRDRGLAA